MDPTLIASPRRLMWAIQENALWSIDSPVYMQLVAEQAKLSAQALAPDAGKSQASGAVKILSLSGVITPHGSPLLALLGIGGGGLNAFRAMFREAVADESVGAIVLNIDSPGGLVDLVPETAAEVRDARGTKPIIAVANTLAASAAYYIASAADEVVVTPSGEVGSIGVMLRHEDLSRRAEMLGVKPTLIFAGKHKTEGNPYEPLSDAAKETMQAAVDTIKAEFDAAVAEGRGVTPEIVREKFGEGRTMLAADAVKAGLADSVATLDETINRLGGGESADGERAEAALPRLAEDDKPAPEASEEKPAEEEPAEKAALTADQRESALSFLLG